MSEFCGLAGFSSKSTYHAIGIERDVAVFLDRIEIADVVCRHHRLRSRAAFDKIGQRFAEKLSPAITSRSFVVQFLSRDDKIDVTDRAEFIGIARRAVIDDFDF